VVTLTNYLDVRHCPPEAERPADSDADVAQYAQRFDLVGAYCCRSSSMRNLVTSPHPRYSTAFSAANGGCFKWQVMASALSRKLAAAPFFATCPPRFVARRAAPEARSR
jgi:hypothetical protein